MSRNEIILDKQNNFVTRYGSVKSEKVHSVIYLRTKSKLTPAIKKKEYNIEVDDIKEKFTSFVNKCIINCNTIENIYLFNIDISSKGLKYGKMSFLRYDLYLRPTKQKSLGQNQFRMQQLSTKLDKYLEKLLNDNGIICK
jgi:predicted RNA-binding protein Jag